MESIPMSPNLFKKDRSLKIIKVAIAYRLLIIFLSVISNATVGEYDSSSEIIFRDPDVNVGKIYSSVLFLLRTFTRWDAVHFLSISFKGYYLEHQFAFFPGLPYTMKFFSHFLYPFTFNITEIARLALSGLILANVSVVLATWVLYKLTYELCEERFAWTSALMFTLTPTPGFMSSFYTEPFFALFAFSGAYFYHKKKFWHASICWMVASTFRSNGMLLAGYFIFDFLFIFRWRLKSWRRCIIKTVTFLVQSTLVLIPFFAFQAYAYQKLCLENDSEKQSSWCHERVPLIYPYVQDHYWNCGFLKYFRKSEIPMFALASPLLILSIVGIGFYAYSDWERFFSIGLRGSKSRGKDYERSPTTRTFNSKSTNYLQTEMLSHVYLWLVLSGYCFFSMHVQVMLRFLTSLPAMYWFAAHVVLSETILTTILTYYWVVYGLISTVLFAGFFPPA